MITNNISSPEAIEETPATEQKTPTAVDRIANVFSWVFVPTLVPFYAMILILWTSYLSMIVPTGTRVVVSLMTLGLTCALPMLIILILKFLGIISDIGLNKRSERPIPYVVVLVCYVFTAWYLYAHGAPDWVTMFYAGGAVASAVNFAVNFFWKISAHSAAMAGVCYVLIKIAHTTPEPSTVAWLMIWLMLTGLLGASRIWLRRHTLLQVMCGYLNGFVCVWLMSLIHY